MKNIKTVLNFKKINIITLKEKILDYSSNPVWFNLQATNQGNIAKVLQNILSAK